MGVSHSGRMVEPQPSVAMVGDVTSGEVAEYELLNMMPSSPSSAVRRKEGSFLHASVHSYDGQINLAVRVPIAWLTQFAANSSPVWLLWAHGNSIMPLRFPSYHTGSRGSLPVSRVQLLGETLASPPPTAAPTISPGGPSSCQISDYCTESLSYQVAKCYLSNTSILPADFDDRSEAYAHTAQLSTEFLVAWTVFGSYPHGEISFLLQARTTGWVGFGVIGDESTAGFASGNGMVDADIFFGHIA